MMNSDKKPNYLVAMTSGSQQSSVALYNLQTKLIVQKISDGDRKHADQLLPLLDECLSEVCATPDQLLGLVANQGPGGFTGVRVTCSVVQGVAFGLHQKVYGVDALQAQLSKVNTQGWSQQTTVISLLDARMNELYIAVYSFDPQNDQWTTQKSPFLMPMVDLSNCLQHYLETQAVHIVGHTQIVQEVLDDLNVTLTPVEELEAQDLFLFSLPVFEQGGFYEPHYLIPLYIRDKIAFTTQERSSGMGGNPKARPWCASGVIE